MASCVRPSSYGHSQEIAKGKGKEHWSWHFLSTAGLFASLS